MKSVDDLQGFYESDLKGSLTTLEVMRKAIVNLFLAVTAITLVVTLGVLVAVAANNGSPFLAFIPLVLGLVGGGIAVNGKYKTYLNDFKSRIIGPIVRFIDGNLTYTAGGCISEQRFRGSGIYQQGIDRYRGDDLVRGSIGDTALEFSEIHAEYKTETRDSKGNRRTHWHTIFKGLFFIGDFNKEFHGKTYVLTDVAEKTLGWLGQKLQEWNLSRDQLVKLEDAEFEKEFAVYSDDQVEARYILSPALMRRLLDFRRRTKKDVQFSFVRSSVHISIPFHEDLFEPRLFRTVVAFEPIQGYFEVLSMAVGVVEDLNLNNRIWTKV